MSLLLSSVLLPAAFCQAQTQPNIIFILADDVGAGDLHCTGHPYAITPNLDKLADQGIRYERAYMAAAWCAPSRYSLMRGQYPARGFYKNRNLKPDEPSITQILKNAGYTTAHFGKWHLNKDLKYAESPGDFGIDEHFTFGSHIKGKKWTSKDFEEEYFRAKTTDYLVDMAIDFIDENNSQKSPSPFYLNLWVYPTHSLINPTPEQLEVYNGLKVNFDDFSPLQKEFLEFVAEHGDIDKSMQAYCADITAMDKALGRLFDFLRRYELDKNTLIVFSSDNGPGPLTVQVQKKTVAERYIKTPTLLNSVGSAKNYRDRKSSIHEGGIRVPFIVSWPGNTKEGKVDNETIFHGVDWLPTIASICNADLPKSNYDGMDLKSAFSGKSIQRKTPVFWSEGASAILENNWKGILKENEFYLYDINKDPSESEDLKKSNPEIAKKMESELGRWLKELTIK